MAEGVRTARRSESNSRAFETAHRQHRDNLLPTVCSDSYLRNVSCVKKKKWQKCGENGGCWIEYLHRNFGHRVVGVLSDQMFIQSCGLREWLARFVRRRTDKFQ